MRATDGGTSLFTLAFSILIMLHVAIARATSHTGLELLHAPGMRMPERARPTLSVSQSFDYAAASTSVAELETAVRIGGARPNSSWSLGSLVFYVVVGRRPQGEPSTVFDIQWDATSLIEKYGGVVRMYADDCKIAPCTRQETQSWKLRSDCVIRTDEYAWGYVHVVGGDLLDTDQNMTVHLGEGEWRWFSLLSFIPATIDGYAYEHWLIVGDGDVPLAFIDRHNTLGQDWTDWTGGVALAGNLYDSIKIPAIHYAAYGANHSTAANVPVDAPSPIVQQAPTQNNPPMPSPDSAQSSTSKVDPMMWTMVGIGVLSVVVIIILVAYAIYRRSVLRGKSRLHDALSKDQQELLDGYNEQNNFFSERSNTSTSLGFSVDARQHSSRQRQSESSSDSGRGVRLSEMENNVG